MKRSSPQERPYPVWLALLTTALFVSPNLVVFATGDVASPEPGYGPSVVALVATLVLQLVLFTAALLPLLLARRLDRRLLGPARRRWSTRAVAVGVAVGIIAAVASYAVNAALVILLGAREPVQQRLLDDAVAGGPTLLLVAAIAVVVAPVTEEIVFRGVLFRSLRDRFGTWLGVFASAAIFSLVHVEVLVSQPAALAGLFAIGVVLAGAYARTGNLVVAIIGHATFNAVSLSLAVMLDAG